MKNLLIPKEKNLIFTWKIFFSPHVKKSPQPHVYTWKISLSQVKLFLHPQAKKHFILTWKNLLTCRISSSSREKISSISDEKRSPSTREKSLHPHAKNVFSSSREKISSSWRKKNLPILTWKNLCILTWKCVTFEGRDRTHSAKRRHELAEFLCWSRKLHHSRRRSSTTYDSSAFSIRAKQTLTTKVLRLLLGGWVCAWRHSSPIPPHPTPSTPTQHPPPLYTQSKTQSQELNLDSWSISVPQQILSSMQQQQWSYLTLVYSLISAF